MHVCVCVCVWGGGGSGLIAVLTQTEEQLAVTTATMETDPVSTAFTCSWQDSFSFCPFISPYPPPSPTLCHPPFPSSSVADVTVPSSCRCSICQRCLNNWYFEKDGQLYCRHDYWSKFGSACNRCSHLITGPLMVSVLVAVTTGPGLVPHATTVLTSSPGLSW